MKTSKFLELIADQDAWPCCPKCKSTELIFSGPFASCVSCMFVGSIRPFIEKNLVVAHSRAKILAGPNGIFGSLFCGPSSSKGLDDRGKQNRRNRTMMANGLGYVMPFMAEACLAAFDNKIQNPYAVIIPEMGAPLRRDVIEIKDPAQAQVARLRASKADVCIVITVSNGVVETTGNIFGVPPFVLSAPAVGKLEADFLPEIRYHDINPDNVLLIQPIGWQVLPFEDTTINPRYLGVINVPGELNISLGVCENMDGAPIIRSIQVDTSSPIQSPVIKSYEIADSDEAVAEMKGKFVALSEAFPSAEQKLEFEWGLDVEIPDLLGDLTARIPDFWGEAIESRGGMTFG